MTSGAPLAMTGFHAQMPDIAQVGGVHTPPALRGQGLARRAVARRLAQMRAVGGTRPTLFSTREIATRATRTTGFRPNGLWTTVTFADPEKD